MKTKIFSAFFILFLCLAAVGAVNASAATYGNLTYKVSGNTIVITGCNKNAANVVIPSEIDGKAVTSIGYRAFIDCSSLTSITIPDSVTSIGDSAFWETQFYNNEANWENGVLYCGKYLLSAKTSITECNIKKDTKLIADAAFRNCTGLASVTIPDSVTSIGASAFEGCTGLTSVIIPDSVTRIGDSAFKGCTSLTSITISDSVTSIGFYAFEYCKNLAKVTIPDSVTSIGKYAFSGCSSIMSVTIPDSVTRIDDSAFSYCTSLASITIPDSVTSIGDSTFSYCTSLTDVIIPDSVTSIGRYAFSGCENIKYVFFKGSRDFWDNEMRIYTGGNDALKNAEIICEAKEKTYNFVTNCEKTLSPVTTYCIAGAPNTETLSRKKYVTGWYDNPVFSGVPVKFPYYSDKTTLYAKWADRTGESFESAVYVPENGSSAITAYTNKYCWIFVPEKTGEYIFKSTAGKYLYLYNSNKTQLASGSNSITFSLAAGEVYYIKNTSMYSFGGTLTVTQAGYKGTSTAISNNGKNIRVVPTDVETGTKITVALYNGDKFVGTKVATYRGGAIEFTTNTEYTSIKVMAWNADNLTPCAKAEVVER